MISIGAFPIYTLLFLDKNYKNRREGLVESRKKALVLNKVYIYNIKSKSRLNRRFFLFVILIFF